jgi:hypothetical protein
MAKVVALVWDESKAYFFKGDQYTRYDIAADQADEGYPQTINSGWAGVFEGDLDAAVVWPNGKAYFFKGDQYIRYDIAADQADGGYPQTINSGWAGVFEGDLDAAVVWPNGKAYFFKGDQYIRYDIEADQADEGYPQSISSGWAGVFEGDLDTAVVWPNGKAYFFKGDQYTRYDTKADQADDGYPKALSAWGLPFDGGKAVSSDEVVSPENEYVEKVLTGAVGLSKLSEAAAILASAETVVETIEPIGAVLEIAHMAVDLWEALETPNRICGYQGLVYGLMYAALDKGNPQPNPKWPNLEDAPDHDKAFFEGVAEAKERLADGQDGARIKNIILLDVAKRGEKTVINNLWQHAIPDSDHLLRMYTIEWPNVGPNG